VTHDNVSHSVPELLDVSTTVAVDQRDVFEPCETAITEVQQVTQR
jgi:hypothetical protein